jgi:hypothetical protein
LQTEFDKQWREGVKDWWQRQYAQIGTAKLRLSELNLCKTTLSPVEQFEHARLLEEFSGADPALGRYHELLAKYPDHAAARFARGRLLLERDDASGIGDLEQAMAQDADATQGACELIMDYLRRHGRERDARPYEDRYWNRQESLNAAEAERRLFKPNERYLPHGLPAPTVESLAAQLQTCSRLKEAYLVRKPVRLLPERACYGLFVLGSGSRWIKSKAGAADLVEEVSRRLPGDLDLRVVSLDVDGKPFIKTLRKIADAQIC